jgi:uncharacterized protein with HEPN domain
MQPDDLLYLGHMLDMARKACERASELDREEYELDEDVHLALTHLVQVIGEAARHVSEEGQLSLPAIPWREIIGMRNRIVHDYLGVDEDVVWEVVTGDLPLLVDILGRVVPAE